MGRDLITRPYGRFFHLPRLLAAQGHDVHMLLLSYRADAALEIVQHGMHWISESLYSFGGLSYLRKAASLVSQVKPDWVIGFSDTYYGILAEHYARRCGTKSLIDAYDNFEGYMPWCRPLHLIWRRAVRNATAISAAGPALAALMTRERSRDAAIVAPMAVDLTGFTPFGRDECRQQLGLPQHVPLIGYCGAIHPNRGISVLFDAYRRVQRSVPQARLVLSGRTHRAISLPPDAIWLGYLPDEKVPVLMNSLNVLTVVNRLSPFGSYSYPIKLYEAMSCQVPIVASRTPATESILAQHEELLCEPDNPEDMAMKVVLAMSRKRIDYGYQLHWGDVAKKLEAFLTETARYE